MARGEVATIGRTGTDAVAEELVSSRPDSQIVLVDRLSVAPADRRRFLEVWAEKTAFLKQQPGFVSSHLRRSNGGAGTYVSIMVWESARALRSALDSPESKALAARYPRSASAASEIVEVGGASYRFGSVEIDPTAREVRKDGRLVRLTRKEYRLLVTLVSRPRHAFTRDELMDVVWGYRATLETGTLTVHVRRLREKLEDDPGKPRYLQTVWGVGYRYVP